MRTKRDAPRVPSRFLGDGTGAFEVRKGVRRMPRLPQAMKDVASCEKPRRGASDP